MGCLIMGEESIKLFNSVSVVMPDTLAHFNKDKGKGIQGVALKPKPLSTEDFGTEIFEPKSTEPVSPLSTGKVSKQAAKPGVVGSIIAYFEKHFGSLSQTETEQVQIIENTLAGAKHLLERDERLLKDIQSAKQNRKGQALSGESLKETATAQNNFKSTLRLVQLKLNKLRNLEQTAETLAQKHSECEALPTQIRALEKKVEVLKGRIAVSDELQKFEEKMIEYSEPNQGSWENFVVIRQQKLKFEETLRKAIEARPELKKDKEIRAFLDQATPVSGETLNRVIQRTYPQLSAHLEHLFDNLSSIQKQRISQLKQKATTLNTLVAAYSKTAKEVASLEQHVYTPSWVDRLFGRQENNQAKLKAKQAELDAVYERIHSTDNFIPAEADWVKMLAHKHSHYQSLSADVSTMSQAFAHIKNREVVSDEMSTLIESLDLYKKNLEFNQQQQQIAAKQQRRSKAQQTSQRSSSVSLKDSITSSMDSSRRRLVKTIAQNLKTSIKAIYEGSQQAVDQLPKGFESLSPIEQLKTLTILAFPKLENRITYLMGLIKTIAELQTESGQQTLAHEVEEIIRDIQKPSASIETVVDPFEQDLIEPETVTKIEPIATKTEPVQTLAPVQTPELVRAPEPVVTSAKEEVKEEILESEHTDTLVDTLTQPTEQASTTPEEPITIVTLAEETKVELSSSEEAAIPQTSQQTVEPTEVPKVSEQSQTSVPKSAVPTPPPPPPPPKVKTATKVTQAAGSLIDQLGTVKLQATEIEPSKKDSKALLMEQIRQPRQLRKVKREESKPDKKLEKATDIAGDLFRAVLARRDAINGKDDKKAAINNEEVNF